MTHRELPREHCLTKSVLIVDDVAFVRRTLSQIFTDAHYRVVGEAADGNEAVQQFARLRPDLVTMDIVMPSMSGIEATRKIIKADKDARVIVISAMGQENLVMEAINVGARDFILKPFTAKEVLKTAARALSDESAPQGRGSLPPHDGQRAPR